jgi:hypothetical protein
MLAKATSTSGPGLLLIVFMIKKKECIGTSSLTDIYRLCTMIGMRIRLRLQCSFFMPLFLFHIREYPGFSNTQKMENSIAYTNEDVTMDTVGVVCVDNYSSVASGASSGIALKVILECAF